MDGGLTERPESYAMRFKANPRLQKVERALGKLTEKFSELADAADQKPATTVFYHTQIEKLEKLQNICKTDAQGMESSMETSIMSELSSMQAAFKRKASVENMDGASTAADKIQLVKSLFSQKNG